MPEKQTAVTLKDLASATGFSTMTVSYVLRGERNFPQRTKEKVFAAARRLGYRPNLHAVSLAGARTGSKTMEFPLGLLIWTPEQKGTSRAKYKEAFPNALITRALGLNAREMGFHLYEHEFRSSEELPRLLKSLFFKGVRGLLIGSIPGVKWPSGIDWGRFSVVTFDQMDSHPLFHSVGKDVFSMVMNTCDEVAARGYRRIGAALCRHQFRILEDDSREGALLRFQTSLAKRSHAIPPFLGEHNDESGFLEWFRQHRPDAVIAFSVFQYYALKSAGYSIPGDVAFVSLLNDPETDGEVASLSGSDCLVAKTALHLMDSLIRHHQVGMPEFPETVLVQPKFQPGRTLPGC